MLIGGPLLIRKLGTELERPIYAFPQIKCPQANRACRAHVSLDRRGRYWLLCDKNGMIP